MSHIQNGRTNCELTECRTSKSPTKRDLGKHYGVVSTPMLILFPRFFVDLKPKGAKCVKTSLATNDKYGNMSRVSGEKKAQKSLCIAHLEVVKRPRGRNWGHAL